MTHTMTCQHCGASRSGSARTFEDGSDHAWRQAHQNCTADAYERAIELALKVHDGQKDKGGEAYILHPLHVMETVDTRGLSAENVRLVRLVAICHDVLEDCPQEERPVYEEALAMIDSSLLRLVQVLTRRPGEEYTDYIERVAADGSLARRVKIADLVHNLDQTRLPPDQRTATARKRYVSARIRLSADEDRTMFGGHDTPH